MKINEIIFEAWINLPPEEAAKEKQAADQEFRALKGIDSPDSVKLADLFRAAFAVTGTVDSAYEKARADMRKLNMDPIAVRDFDKAAKGYASAIKGDVDPIGLPDNAPIFRQKGDRVDRVDISNMPVPSGPGPSEPGPGRGKYTKYRDGSDRAGKPKGPAGRAVDAVGDWADEYFGDLPGAGLVKKAAKGAKKVGSAVTAPVRAITDPVRSGYDFLGDLGGLDAFRQGQRRRSIQ